MQKINLAYRGKDKPTDVLSFAALDVELPAALKNVSQKRFLGDIIISADTMMRQAKEFRVTPEAELDRLMIHGILHLLGYDHENVPKREAEKMRRKEDSLLQVLAKKEPHDR